MTDHISTAIIHEEELWYLRNMGGHRIMVRMGDAIVQSPDTFLTRRLHKKHQPSVIDSQQHKIGKCHLRTQS